VTLDLEGRVAIVTGAAGALGRAVTGQFLERGASVVAVDVEPITEGGALAAVEGDVSVATTAERAVSVARERFGGLDVLVCNAGRIVWKPVVETTEEEWDRVQAVNVKGTFLFCRAARSRPCASAAAARSSARRRSRVSSGCRFNRPIRPARARSSNSRASLRSSSPRRSA
jgi:NAD(P)-dependent dehydrogenase (short-subunit alcohol dehydrogenase family)